ncbi:hypothetical protein MBGDN05_00876 [Thermoplasmatales archaeon SCGC AB-539-N05]|nr:hypothetical protein MBGDN05_00876 [Thermoplasmatales archaeon SCGC AB-539-N05]
MRKKILNLGIILILILGMISIPTIKAKELIQTFTSDDWENFDSSHNVGDGSVLYTDYGTETENNNKEHVLVDCSCGIHGALVLTQKAWHTVSWTTPREDDFQFVFDYRAWGDILVQGLTIWGFNTGWCNVSVFIQVKDVDTDSYWINYERCVAAKSDILFPISQGFDEDLKYSSRKCHMAEGTDLIIKVGINVQTFIIAGGLAAEACYSNIYGKINNIKIYSEYDPSQPILGTDPDPPSHDFGEQYKGVRWWSFNVYNSGGGNLDYDIEEDCPGMWIFPNIFGQDYFKHYLIIDTSELDYGHHECTFTINSNGGKKTGTIEVDVVNAPPFQPYNCVPENEATGVDVAPWALDWESSDLDDDVIKYDVYFGTDSTPDSGELICENLPVSAYIGSSPPQLEYGTDYYWRIDAKDDHGHTTIGQVWTFTTNKKPNKPNINGPTSGKKGTEYAYTISATDPDGHDIYYQIFWGDGTSTPSNSDEWLGPYASGETCTQYHTWNRLGTYIITVKAKDIHGATSEATKEVSMPKNKAINQQTAVKTASKHSRVININPLSLQFLEQHLRMLPILRLIIQLLQWK